MRLDACVLPGPFPFRRVPANTPEALRAHLIAQGIDGALAVPVNAVYYRAPQDGNEWLFKQLSGIGGGFFRPVCVINPDYPGWERDLERSVETLGFRAAALYPYIHGYRLGDAPGVRALGLCGEMGVPVLLPCAIENIRQRHRLDADRNLDPDEVFAALSAESRASVLIVNGFSPLFAERLAPLFEKRTGEILLDFARLEPLNGSVARLIEMVGAKRVIFSTQAPLQYVAAQTVKLDVLRASGGLSRPDMDAIEHGNLKRLLGEH